MMLHQSIKEGYWDRVKADQLPEGLDLCVFDWAVNSGTGRAAKKLQAMIGTTVDGGIGSNTLRALKMYCDTEGIEAAISDYTKMRQEFYEGLRRLIHSVEVGHEETKRLNLKHTRWQGYTFLLDNRLLI